MNHSFFSAKSTWGKHAQWLLPLLIMISVFCLNLVFWRLLFPNVWMSLSSHLLSITLLREIMISVLLGVTVYLLLRSYTYGHHIKQLLATTQSTLEATMDGILLLDEHGQILTYNQRFATLLKMPPPADMLSNLDNQHAPLLDILFAQLENSQLLRAKIQDPMASGIIEIYVNTGEIFEVSAVLQKVDDYVVGSIFSFHDITRRKQVEKELLYHATHDLLTGLSNRMVLFERIKQAIHHTKREPGLLAILFFDLDHFKPVNDSLGHSTGDLLLKAIADRLLSHTRKEDTLARLGGDEFVLLLVGLKKEESALMIAQRYIQAISEPFYIQDQALHLGCTIGISFYPKDGETAELLLKNADMAMYHAKKSHHPIQLSSFAHDKQISERLLLDSELRRALENEEFFLCYQPIIEVQTGKISALEALIRWRHPQRGIVLPSTFIPIAEKTDVIVHIGNWIIRTACHQANLWLENNFFKGMLNINISEKQIKQTEGCEELLRLIKETGFPPHLLTLELTESTWMKAKPTQALLAQFKEAGFSIAIDDFGMEYSNLGYLKYFPIDKLKIDQIFVKGIPSEEIDNNIVSTILNLAKNLNLKTTVEGVEKIEQLSFLREYGCDEVQGFLFSPPLEAPELACCLTDIQRKIKAIL